jgi:hypothetical protein
MIAALSAVLTEAMAAKKAIVASDVEAFPK